MATKIRLQRRGKKGKPFYHIVIADGRAPRDGKSIEKIGSYNPIPHPAEILLDFDKAIDWLQKGAQPTETVRSILALKGVLYKNHLLKGVKKGALTEQEAEAKFQGWITEKEAKAQTKINDSQQAERDAQKKRLEAERKVNLARAEQLAKLRAVEVEAQVKAIQEAEGNTETPEAPATAPAPVVEAEVKEEPKKDEPKAEKVKAEEPKKEEPKAE